ncbi:MAG TPA: aldehyde dehydrogenase family protein [Vicinamibacterales bacterium]|nr:aldehyde dehydrogenase family protein [Vicinamibacterales bacterium]
MLHIPLIRRGVPYKSLDVAYARHHATGDPFVEISHANPGLIRRDLLAQGAMREALLAIPTARLIDMTRAAAAIFAQDALPVGDTTQSPEDYVHQVSATTGMPYAMVRRNVTRIAAVMENVSAIVRGLTRGLDPTVLDRGYGEADGQVVSFFPRSRALGIVLPSNSPGVHGLWVPAIALKMPLVLRPGSAEPWTPYRLIQALMKAGVPGDAFNFFPSDHAGAGEIVRHTGRSLFFGDVAAVGAFSGDPRIELHGPGYSKIVFGADRAPDWVQSLDIIIRSVAENGGRSCVNASGVWTPSHGAEIAGALAQRLAAIEPRAADDPDAEIAPFVDARVADHINAQIETGLAEPGAIDVTARYRKGPRLVVRHGSTYLLPTVIHCASASHPLANREFLFPYVSVVDMSPRDLACVPDCFGQTLSATVLTDDRSFIQRLLGSAAIGRLNLGPIQTNAIAWEQPHEGNLFDHLYGRRAFQAKGLAGVGA